MSCALSASISFSILSISDFKWIFRLLICAYSSVSTPLACQQVPNSLSCEPWPAHTALLWLVLKPAQSCPQDLLILERYELALSRLEAAWRWRSGSAFVDGMRSRHRCWWGRGRPCLRCDGMELFRQDSKESCKVWMKKENGCGWRPRRSMLDLRC